MGRPGFILLACLGLSGLTSAPSAQVGSVFAEQKIGESTGGFGGTLASLDGFGQSVAPLGDLDGDGIGDLLVGAPRELAAVRPGRAWVLFMEEDGRVRDEIEIAPMTPLGTTDQFGSSVAALGNLPGMTGALEVAVGASGTVGGGAVWILSLNTAGVVVEQRSLVGTGVSSGDQFGSALARLGAPNGVGDVNGDGTPDLAVGARLANDGGVDAGALWVLLLNPDGTIQSQTRISDLVGGFSGAGGNLDAQDNFGSGLASPGDVDGDGPADLLVGAPGDDDAGSDAGAVWMLYLNASGSVKATHKVPAPIGVLAGDRFGTSVAALGNLDLAGGIEIAAGAPRDDDGATDRGAAWILFLDAAEMPLSALELSDTQGAFTGDLNGGLFGSSVALVGDLDQDGRIELAVGESAAFAPVAGVAAGAVWIVSLVGPGDSVWTGANSTDWFDAGNWSLGLPGPAKAAVVRQTANAPVIAANALDATCQDLALGKFASLTLASAAETLEVGRNVRAQGDIGGIGDLRLVGDGSLVSVSPVNAPVVVDTAGTVELRGTAAALNDGLSLVAGRLDVCEGCRTTVVGLADFGAGLLRGTGTLDVNGDAFFAATDVATPPTMEFSGDVTVDGAFAPTSGVVVFDGIVPQTIVESGPGTVASFFDVVVMPSADVSATESVHTGATLLLDGSLAIVGQLTVDGALTGASSDAALLVGGTGATGSCTVVRLDVTFPGGIYGTCMFEVSNPSMLTVVLDVPGGFPGDLLLDTNGTVLLASSTLTVAQNLKVLSGTFRPTGDAAITAGAIVVEAPGRLDAASRELSLLGDVPVTVRGELAVGSGGALRLDESPVSIESGGMLELLGAPGDRARILEATGGGRYALTIQDGASLIAQEFGFETMDAGGIRIVDTSGTGTIDMEEGLFDGVDPGGVLLEISRFQPATFEGVAFGATGIDVMNLPPGTYNVRVPAGSALIGFSNWLGDFGGPLYDAPAEEAVWGATLVSFEVKEGKARNEVRWQTSAESDVIGYLVDRAELPGGAYGAPVLVPAVGPSSYALQDVITPGRAYRYRLRERLQSGVTVVDSLLGTRDTDGLPTGLSLAPPPPVHPLVGSTGHGTVPGLLDALASAGATGSAFVRWQLDGGIHESFALTRGGWTHLDLSPVDGESAVIDASGGPLLVHSLRPEQSLVLSGLVVDAGDPDRPALVIDSRAGTVLLDGMELRGRMLVRGSTRVLLQDGTTAGVELHAAARLEAFSGAIDFVRVDGCSRLETSGVRLRTAPSVARGSRWLAFDDAPRLAILPRQGQWTALLEAAPGGAWVVLATGSLGELLGPRPAAPWLPLGLSRGGSLRGELSLPESDLDPVLYLRGARVDSFRGEPGRTNIVRLPLAR